MTLLDAKQGSRIPVIVIHKGMRLAAARQLAGLTQEDMAEMLGCSRRTIIRYEADDTSAPPAVVLAYSVASDVNLGWLETGTAPAEAKAVECAPRDLNPEPTD